MKKKTASIDNALCSLSLSMAKSSVNGYCLMILHQPKVPQSLKDKYQKN